jgi:hypothetical protein
MAATIITPEDLQNFKQELLTEIQKLLSQRQTTPSRKWLKSNEVRRLLLLSPGTLQNLRVNGTLPFTKIGGVIFYDYDDIQKMIEEHKRNPHFAGKKLNT